MLTFLSGMAFPPLGLAMENAWYLLVPVVLFPFVLVGLFFWLLQLALVGVSRAVTYRRLMGQKCPSCGERKWAWPVLESKDTTI